MSSVDGLQRETTTVVSGLDTLLIEMVRLQFSWSILISDFWEIHFFLRTIIDSIYKLKSIQISTKKYLHNKINY